MPRKKTKTPTVSGRRHPIELEELAKTIAQSKRISLQDAFRLITRKVRGLQ